MTNISPYLTFSGNCREAMTFYQECLGGDLFFQTVGESPLSGKMPKKIKDFIVHATLTRGDMVLQGSDMVPQSGLVRGNNISLVIHCGSEEEIKDLYAKLAAGGKARHPVEDTFWGAMFGGLTDRFGNEWLLNFNKEPDY